MKRFLVVIMIMLPLIVVGGAKALTMQDLIEPNASLTVEDKRFSNFIFLSATISPANIVVQPIDTPFNPGLRFSGGLFAREFNVVDVFIGYTVEVLPGGAPIKDISLLTAGYVERGQGNASVGESVFLGNKLIGSLQNTIDEQYASADFDPTYGPIRVLKDILLIATEQGDFAALSYVEQRFSETTTAIPEPATMLLFGSGLMGLAVFMRKKIKR